MAKARAVVKARNPTHVKDLVPDPANRRRHNPRNLGMVVDALHQVGAARSIVIDEDNVILAGNGVTEAAAEAGITRVRVIEASGEELIAVRRSGLTEAQKRSLAMYDNRTAELAEWNPDQLQADLAAGLDLKPWFTDEELKREIGAAAVTGGLTDPDDVPAERATDIRVGDLFLLGRHRLLCGDCTDPALVERLMEGARAGLMNTDPPYGVTYTNDERPNPGVAKPRVANDTLSEDALQRFLESAFGVAKLVAQLGGVVPLARTPNAGLFRSSSSSSSSRRDPSSADHLGQAGAPARTWPISLEARAVFYGLGGWSSTTGLWARARRTYPDDRLGNRPRHERRAQGVQPLHAEAGRTVLDSHSQAFAWRRVLLRAVRWERPAVYRGRAARRGVLRRGDRASFLPGHSGPLGSLFWPACDEVGRTGAGVTVRLLQPIVDGSHTPDWRVRYVDLCLWRASFRGGGCE